MLVKVKMPDLSTSDTPIRIIRWLVEPGQPVKQGQVLLEVETDKAAMEVESYMSGVLKEIVASPDTAVEVGQIICVIES